MNSTSKQACAPQETLVLRNEQLLSENRMLREECCKMQEAHLKDKAKIQLLIGRMSQLKCGHLDFSPNNE